MAQARPLPANRFRALAQTAMILALAMPACLSVPQATGEATMEPPPRMTATVERSLARGSVTAGNWPADKWWEGFGDSALNALVQRALANSPDIKIARARAELAENIAKAAGAVSSPKAGVGADISGQRISENSWLPANYIKNPFYVAGAAVDLGYNLDLWGAARLAAEGKIGAHMAARAEARVTHLAVSAAVTRSYLRLADIRALSAIAEEALASRRESLGMIRRKMEKGLETELNVERAIFAVTVAEDAKASLALAEALERDQLAALIGAGPDEAGGLGEPSTPAAESPPAIPANLPLDLIHRRADVTAARWRVEAAAKGVKAARAAFYPNINLRALVGLQSTDLGKLLNGGSLVYNVTGAVHLPLFDGGAIAAGLGAARAEYDMAVARYNQTALGAAQEAAGALSQVESLSQRMEIARRALATAKKVYKLASNRFERGLDDYITTLKAQDDLFIQARAVAQLSSAMAQARVALICALGGGFTETAFNDGRYGTDE